MCKQAADRRAGSLVPRESSKGQLKVHVGSLEMGFLIAQKEHGRCSSETACTYETSIQDIIAPVEH